MPSDRRHNRLITDPSQTQQRPRYEHVPPPVVRMTPKVASSLSSVRRDLLAEQVEQGSLREGGSYTGSLLRNPPSAKPPAEDGEYRRGQWVPAYRTGDGGKPRKAQAVIAHSDSFRKQAASIGTVGGMSSVSSAGSGVERMAPEVYSPLFTMANLNLPRDRITVNAWCFLPGTMVWMADGTRKAIEDIRIGDIVLSGEGMPRRVTSLFRRDVDEEIVGLKVKGSQETIWCTQNHGFNAVKAEDVRCHDKNAFVKCKPDGGPKKGFCGRCGRENDPYRFQKIEAGQLEQHDFVYMPIPQLKPLSKDPILDSAEGMELLGYYAAEGCSNIRQTIFTFGIHEEKQAERVECLVRKFFPKASFVRYDRLEKSIIQLHVNDKKAARFFSRHCGKTAATKLLSRELVSANSEILSSFLAAWMDGDGSQEKYNGQVFAGSTASEQLAYQIRMVALRCGMVAHVFYDHSQKTMVSPTNGKTYATKPRYYVKLRGKSAVRFSQMFRSTMYRFGEVPRKYSRDGCSFILDDKAIQWISSVSKRKYAGSVYNIEVETDHTYTVGYGVSVQNCRNFFDLHPLVRNAITLHATYPISKINIKCEDKRVEAFFEDMIEEMDLLGALGEISLEYWKLGEAFPYAELDERTMKWKRIIVQNPDYVHVKKTVVASEPVIALRPDAVLQRLVMSSNPADVQLRKQIPEPILFHVRRGENIPLDNFNVSHLKLLSSPYDVRGTSIIVSVFKDLMLYDKLREAKFAQADGLVNPITLVKVGGTAEGEYHPTPEDLEEWRHVIEEAQYDKDFKIVTHHGITIERVGASGAVLDIAGDMELIIKNIHHGLMVPQAIIDTESAVYASASIGLEVLRQRYFNFRNMLAKWLMNKIFAPISDLQGFYRLEGGRKKLIVPEIEWNHMNLYDLQDYISSISSLVTTKQVSLQTLYRSLGLNYEDERKKLRQEMVNDTIRAREEAALGGMDLTELRSLDPEQEIMPPVPAEQAPGGAPAGGGMPGGGMPGGEMGGGFPPMPGGGGGGGGLPGGLPELAPPPGEALGPPGAGAPGGGGVTPPLGPGTPGGPPGGGGAGGPGGP